MFFVLSKFESSHVNPLTGRVGQWRVTCSIPAKPHFVAMLRDDYEIGVLCTKPFRTGSIIRPHKELNKTFMHLKQQGEQHDQIKTVS